MQSTVLHCSPFLCGATLMEGCSTVQSRALLLLRALIHLSFSTRRLPRKFSASSMWLQSGTVWLWKFPKLEKKKRKSLKACGLQVAKFSVYLDVSCEPTTLKNVSEHSHRGTHSLVGHRPYLSPLHSFMWSSPTPILWFWWPMVSTKRKGFETWMIWTWIQALAGRTVQAKGPASVNQFPQW